jgi:hypothetical protein
MTSVMEQPSLLTDLREFVELHRVHGELHAGAGEPTPNGYRLEVACPCSVVFERWVVPDDAAGQQCHLGLPRSFSFFGG